MKFVYCLLFTSYITLQGAQPALTLDQQLEQTINALTDTTQRNIALSSLVELHKNPSKDACFLEKACKQLLEIISNPIPHDNYYGYPTLSETLGVFALCATHLLPQDMDMISTRIEYDRVIQKLSCKRPLLGVPKKMRKPHQTMAPKITKKESIDYSSTQETACAQSEAAEVFLFHNFENIHRLERHTAKNELILQKQIKKMAEGSKLTVKKESLLKT